jgi:hypothetical protein
MIESVQNLFTHARIIAAPENALTPFMKTLDSEPQILANGRGRSTS